MKGYMVLLTSILLSTALAAQQEVVDREAAKKRLAEIENRLKGLEAEEAARKSELEAEWREGPFGLGRGMTVQDLAKAGVETAQAPGEPHHYDAKVVPKPHPSFELFRFTVGPKSGLCQISSVSRDIGTSAYGNELRSAFADLRGQLVGKYGDPEDRDELAEGSIWNEPRDWMTGLRKKERSLGSIWTAMSAGRDLGHRLIQISLQAAALDDDLGYLRLSYYFSNWSECQEEIAGSLADSL